MNVLLTGASGFIGRNALLASPRDWAITAVYRNTSIDAFVRQHGLTHVTPVACDLSNAADVDRLVGARSFDLVLYLAANGDPAISATRPVWDLESNALAPLTLLERLNAGRFVFMSSGAVYDGLRGGVTPETSVAPRLPYAISKLAAENYIRFFAERRRSIASYANVRFFGAYGPYTVHTKRLARSRHAGCAASSTANASSKSAATARTSSTSCMWTMRWRL
jgi:nucleoside-diphosphate-sugar epimerase